MCTISYIAFLPKDHGHRVTKKISEEGVKEGVPPIGDIY